MIVWRPAARADFARIVHHIADENPYAAKRVGRELILVADSLETFPNRGRRGRIPGTRELVIVVPYVLVYEVRDEAEVFILRIWHGSQERS